MSRLFRVLYVATLALLPWQWLPLPWLPARAQWSDVLFLLATLAWLRDRAVARDWPRPRALHLAMAAYLAWGVVSHLAAAAEPRAGTWKLLGMAELCVLAVVTADVARRPHGMPLIGRAFAWTTLATAVAAVAGVLLYLGGRDSALLTDLGDLEPGSYPRLRAGFHLPNLLASFTLTAAGVVAHPQAALPRALKRCALAALVLAAALSLSRGILGLVLTSFLWAGDTPTRRRLARAWALVSALAIAGLSNWNVAIDPLRPSSVHLRSQPSSRRAAVTSSWETLARRPFVGVGPGKLPGRRSGQACDAHLTPLNIAATLGVPALLAFAAIPVLLWRERRHPTDASTWIALAGLGIDALGQDVEDFRHLWISFGLAAAGAAPPQRC